MNIRNTGFAALIGLVLFLLGNGLQMVWSVLLTSGVVEYSPEYSYGYGGCECLMVLALVTPLSAFIFAVMSKAEEEQSLL